MNKHQRAFENASQFIAGGVNSPVRAFKGVGGTPIFFKQGKGSQLTDIENKTYIDYVGSWGPMILGHAHDDVIQAITNTLCHGISFGAPTEIESILAEKIVNRIDAVDRIRMCNSGTEATMSAIRLARGYTNKDFIVKFEGCYHGHSDSLLVKAGSGMLTLGTPTSPGVPKALAEKTFTLPYNDANAINTLFKQYGNQIAGVIFEPIAGNMNLIIPHQSFLNAIHQNCDQYGAILIADEVMTGFRVAYGGATELLKLKPDLITYGKVIGGGMPVGAFGGKKEIMDRLSPLGDIYQAGTLSGNPVAMAAGLSTLEATEKEGFYTQLEIKTYQLISGIQSAADEIGLPLFTRHVCGMFGLFFTEKSSINQFDEVMRCDTQLFAKFFHLMLNEGIYLAPSAFEAGFMSIAHSNDDINNTIQAARNAFKQLK